MLVRRAPRHSSHRSHTNAGHSGGGRTGWPARSQQISGDSLCGAEGSARRHRRASKDPGDCVPQVRARLSDRLPPPLLCARLGQPPVPRRQLGIRRGPPIWQNRAVEALPASCPHDSPPSISAARRWSSTPRYPTAARSSSGVTTVVPAAVDLTDQSTLAHLRRDETGNRHRQGPVPAVPRYRDGARVPISRGGRRRPAARRGRGVGRARRGPSPGRHSASRWAAVPRGGTS